MASDGKALEALVAYVEETLLPQGFTVKPNARVFNDEGVQIAEFDIEVHGKVGSTTIAWLIECRDRPGQGPAPGSWIEQLVGRRTRFGFNKVTAVSTTGFAAGAASFAQAQGIELREVRSLDPSEFKGWLHIEAMVSVRRICDLRHANIILLKDQVESIANAAIDLIKSADGRSEILVSSVDGSRATLTQAFLAAVNSLPGDPFTDVSPGAPKTVQMLGRYPPEDHYWIETSEGRAAVAEIEFFGELRVEEKLLPVVRTVEYRQVTGAETISQLASFAPDDVAGMKIAVELHRFADSGETHVVLRRVPDDA